MNYTMIVRRTVSHELKVMMRSSVRIYNFKQVE